MMRALLLGIALVGLAPTGAFAWMSSVGRNLETGERTSYSARLDGEDGATLAVICRTTDLSATYDTRLQEGWDVAEFNAMNPQLLVKTGSGTTALPALGQIIVVGENNEFQLLLGPAEASQLAALVTDAPDGVDVSFSLNDTEMNGAHYLGGAPDADPIGWVLEECGAKPVGKTKG